MVTQAQCGFALPYFPQPVRSLPQIFEADEDSAACR